MVFDNGIKVLYIYMVIIYWDILLLYIHYIQYDTIIGYMSQDITNHGPPGRGWVLSLGSESHSSSLFNAYDVYS